MIEEIPKNAIIAGFFLGFFDSTFRPIKSRYTIIVYKTISIKTKSIKLSANLLPSLFSDILYIFCYIQVINATFSLVNNLFFINVGFS
jgi:hypothetical protein